MSQVPCLPQRVLFIDDDPNVLAGLRRALRLACGQNCGHVWWRSLVRFEHACPG